MVKKTNNKVSEKATVDLLGRLFAGAGSDELTLDAVYAAAGRADMNSETNRNWLNGILAKLCDHSLVTAVNKYENSRSRLDKIKLTVVGKHALGWPSMGKLQIMALRLFLEPHRHIYRPCKSSGRVQKG